MRTTSGSTHFAGAIQIYSVNSPDGINRLFRLDDGFVVNGVNTVPQPPSVDPGFNTNADVDWWQYQEVSRLPETWNWTLSVQRELPGHFLVEASYSASIGAHLMAGLLNYNQLPSQYIYDSRVQPLLNSAISSAAVRAAGFNKPYTSFPDNLSLDRALRPFPQYANINTWSGNGDRSGHSTYHAAILKMERRVSTGVYLQGSYVFSKLITDIHPKAIWESAPYVRMLPKLFDHLRAKLGDEVELLHDVHERVTLPQAIQLCKDIEKHRLFFLEDPFPPEENDHFRLLRQQTSTPLAMGELFNAQHEYLPLIKDRLIDFIRIHISQIGGLSPARKVQALSEFFGVRTAWHGPGDASPAAHAAQLALELASYNFGIHEGYVFLQNTKEVFPGCPEVKDGYMFAQEKPGLGIDLDEKLAAKFPFPEGPPNFDYSWGTTRRRDGTVIRP